MMVPINYLAVVLAAVASVILGSLWYGPIFGKYWISLAGFTPQQIEEGKKKGMGKSYALTILGSLVMSYVLAHSLVFAAAYLKVSGAPAGVMAGFWSWLGFVVPSTMSDFIWGGRPMKLWLLNIGYYLVALVVMGVILALM